MYENYAKSGHAFWLTKKKLDNNVNANIKRFEYT